MAFFLLVSGLCSSVATSGFSHGIITSKRTKDLVAFFVLSLSTIVIVSLLSIGIVIFFILYNSQAFDFKQFGLLIPCYIVLISLNSLFQILLNKQGNYSKLSKTRVYAVLVAIIIQITFGILKFGSWGLIGAYFASTLVLNISYILYYKAWIQNNLRLFSFNYSKIIFYRHSDFLKYSTPSDIINSFIHQVPLLSISYFFNQEQTGSYVFAERLLGMPFSIFSSSFGELFRKSAMDELIKVGSCRHSFIKTLKILLIIAAIIFSLIFFLSPILFINVFGEKWAIAGEIASLLSLLYFSRFVVSPLTYVFILKNKQKEDFLLHIIMPLWIVLIISLSWYLFGNNFSRIILSYSIGSSLIYFYYFFKSYKLSL